MGDYNRNDRSGGGSGGNRYGGRAGGGGRSFGGGRDFDRQMYSATCAKCGNECKVPFKPTGERPVYCSNCFESMRGSDDAGRGGRRDSGRPSFDDRRPRDRDERTAQPPAQNNGKIIEMLNSLHLKMDKILATLEPKAVKPTVTKKKAKVEKIETEKNP